MKIDTNQLYQQVAAEAWRVVNEAYIECMNNTSDNAIEDTETYLYVFADGSWTVDHAQYIPTTNGCISAVPIGLYNGPAELLEDIEANEDWDAIEEAEDNECE